MHSIKDSVSETELLVVKHQSRAAALALGKCRKMGGSDPRQTFESTESPRGWGSHGHSIQSLVKLSAHASPAPSFFLSDRSVGHTVTASEPGGPREIQECGSGIDLISDHSSSLWKNPGPSWGPRQLWTRSPARAP